MVQWYGVRECSETCPAELKRECAGAHWGRGLVATVISAVRHHHWVGAYKKSLSINFFSIIDKNTSIYEVVRCVEVIRSLSSSLGTLAIYVGSRLNISLTPPPQSSLGEVNRIPDFHAGSRPEICCKVKFSAKWLRCSCFGRGRGGWLYTIVKYIVESFCDTLF